MKCRYDDIVKRIPETPKWWDQNGTPRYDDFHPELCPNIYADRVVLLEIACQDCKQRFMVEMNSGPWPDERNTPPKKLHYGDPPIHGCVGDTMNCDDLKVLQVWQRIEMYWMRYWGLEDGIDEESESTDG